jgi:hypothetical protein
MTIEGEGVCVGEGECGRGGDKEIVMKIGFQVETVGNQNINHRSDNDEHLLVSPSPTLPLSHSF